MTVDLAIVLLVSLLAVPHLLPRARLAPVAGITLWMSALALRAAIAISGVIAFMLYVPTSDLFSHLSQWCLHAVIPYLTAHLGLNGHALGDLASVVPAGLVLLTAAAAAGGTWRACRRVSGWLKRSTLGDGPAGSVIVKDSEMVIAAAGVRQPRVVVSAGALMNLDDGELAAGLQHEWGHVERRHRFLSLTSVALLGCSRLIPGGRAACRNLQFHIERDADDYAVRKTGDPMALASAIFKLASTKAPAGAGAIAHLGEANAVDRLRLLVADLVDLPARELTLAAAMLGAAMAVTAVSLLAVVPELAQAGMAQAHVPVGGLVNC